MATAYLAGILALEVQKHGPSSGRATNEAVKARLQNTARPIPPTADAALPESVAKIGAGLVDALAFLTSAVTVTPSNLALGDAPKWPNADKKVVTLTVRNTGDKEVTYTPVHTPSRSVLGEGKETTDDFIFSDTHAGMDFDKRTLTVPARGEDKLTVTINANVPLIGKLPADGHWVLSGFVTLQTADRKDQLSVPYAVVTGDYSTWQVLHAPGTGTEPALTNAVDITKPVAANTKFDLASDAGTPVLRFETMLSIRLAVTALLNAKDKSIVGYVDSQEFVGGLETRVAAFSGVALPSLTSKDPVKPVPNGDYILALQIVKPKALKFPDDLIGSLETVFESPVFTLERAAGK